MTVSHPVDAAKGRVLIVGATGFIGQFVAEASLGSGRPTYLLARPLDINSSKAKTIKNLQDKGAIIINVPVFLSLSLSLSLNQGQIPLDK